MFHKLVRRHGNPCIRIRGALQCVRGIRLQPRRICPKTPDFRAMVSKITLPDHCAELQEAARRYGRASYPQKGKEWMQRRVSPLSTVRTDKQSYAPLSAYKTAGLVGCHFSASDAANWC